MPVAKKLNKLKPEKKAKRTKLRNYLTTSLLISGVVLVLFGLIKQALYNRAIAPVLSETEIRQTATTSAVPRRMVIGDKIDVALDEAILVGNKWTVSPNNGTYLLNSARLGEVGNLIIYGHNLRQIFGNLKVVKVGDEVRLSDMTGKVWPYLVSKVIIVNPKETSWLTETDIPILTIYTCIGPWDSQRLIVRAIPVNQTQD